MLLIEFNAELIEASPPFVLGNLKTLRTQLDAKLSQLAQVTTKMAEVKVQILQDVQGFLDTPSILAPLSKIWHAFHNFTSNVTKTYETVSAQATRAISTARPIAGAAIFVPAALFGVLVGTAAVITALFMVEAIKSGLLRAQPLKYHTTGRIYLLISSCGLTFSACFSNCGPSTAQVFQHLDLFQLWLLCLCRPLHSPTSDHK